MHTLTNGTVPLTLTLLELNQQIKNTLVGAFPNVCLVTAEIAKINSSTKCVFFELVQKQNGNIVASLESMLYRDRYCRINDEFESVTGEPLRVGMSVLLYGRVHFHEQYGLRLSVEDIDGSYTLGEMERRRREVLERLSREGLLELNRQHAFPLVAQRIAILSSANAAGYEDFVRQLQSNPYGFQFSCVLFGALLQGDEAERSMVDGLRRIRACSHLFDVTVIIRGGGSATDLSAFDGYALSAEIASHPLPVVTGIGHDRDETIADKVACRAVKTPTAAAELLLSRAKAFDDHLVAARESLRTRTTTIIRMCQAAQNQVIARFGSTVTERVRAEQSRLRELVNSMAHAASGGIGQKRQSLETLAYALRRWPAQRLATRTDELIRRQEDLETRLRFALERKSERIGYLEQIVRSHDPDNVLRRGYSITLYRGKPVKSALEIESGALLHTRLYHGMVTSRAESAEEQNDEHADYLQRGHDGIGADRPEH